MKAGALVRSAQRWESPRPRRCSASHWWLTTPRSESRRDRWRDRTMASRNTATPRPMAAHRSITERGIQDADPVPAADDALAASSHRTRRGELGLHRSLDGSCRLRAAVARPLRCPCGFVDDGRADLQPVWLCRRGGVMNPRRRTVRVHTTIAILLKRSEGHEFMVGS
jgi:hypothetical protein